MVPWKIAVGVALAGGGILAAVLGRHFEYLAPYTDYIIAKHGFVVALHFGGAVAAIGLVAGALARSLGLVDVGRKVDVIDRSIRRGDASPELGRLLQEEDEGIFTE